MSVVAAKPHRAYGVADGDAPPCGRPAGVTPGASIEWEVELLGFTQPVNWHQAELDDVLKDAFETKEQGNALYKEGKHALARKKYEGTLGRLKGLRGLDAEEEAAANAIKLSVHLNLAACLQKLDEHTAAVAQCTAALETCDPESVKALYRRATSLIVLSRFNEARQDLLDAEGLDPAVSADCKKLMAKLVATQARRKRRLSCGRWVVGCGVRRRGEEMPCRVLADCCPLASDVQLVRGPVEAGFRRCCCSAIGAAPQIGNSSSVCLRNSRRNQRQRRTRSSLVGSGTRRTARGPPRAQQRQEPRSKRHPQTAGRVRQGGRVSSSLMRTRRSDDGSVRRDRDEEQQGWVTYYGVCAEDRHPGCPVLPLPPPRRRGLVVAVGRPTTCGRPAAQQRLPRASAVDSAV